MGDAYQRRAEFGKLAAKHGFELAGACPARELDEYLFYQQWIRSGYAADMSYLTDGRGEKRRDPRLLLASARSVLCVGRIYHTQHRGATPDEGQVSSYAWGEDYHNLLRDDMAALVSHLTALWGDFEYKICVDTAPLLERAVGRAAGLGWIGKNTCLINQEMGSWFFIGAILVSLAVAPDSRPPDRCGTCTRCLDACPTDAFVPIPDGEGPKWALDAGRCISYLTIELRGAIPEHLRSGMGNHVFGCDICQDVCPWNDRSPVSSSPGFEARHANPSLEASAALTADEFRQRYRESPVWRTKHRGFLRNVAVAMGNSGKVTYKGALQVLAEGGDEIVKEHALWALAKLDR